jgi:hypothetical protein
MKTEYITLTGLNEGTLSVPEEVSNQREELEISCYAVKQVTNAQQAEQAALVLKEATQFVRMIEASRKIVKDPVTQLGKKIDTFAAELTTALEADLKRVGNMLGTFQAEENRKAEIAARAAACEEQRIKDEANAKIKAAQIAAKSEAAFERKAEKIIETAKAEIVEVKQAAVAVAAPKQFGIATKKIPKFEVLDIAALYAARPECVKLEPNNTLITALIKGNPSIVIPGLRHWIETGSIVR